jgi:hypothetical protein
MYFKLTECLDFKNISVLTSYVAMSEHMHMHFMNTVTLIVYSLGSSQ